MEIDTDKINDAVLALLQLTLHDGNLTTGMRSAACRRPRRKGEVGVAHSREQLFEKAVHAIGIVGRDSARRSARGPDHGACGGGLLRRARRYGPIPVSIYAQPTASTASA
jgi:hypothetical protein